MDLGSGNELLMNSSVSRPLSVQETKLVPKTQRYEKVTTSDFLNTSSSLYTRLADFQVHATTANNLGISRAISQNRQFYTFSADQSAPTETNGFDTTDATLPGPMEGGHVVLIVGLTCGLLGLFLGILLTAGVGMYITKRRNKTATRGRRKSGCEKNPKEMTFEPIDLSKTFPSYVEEPRPTERRTSYASNLPNNVAETNTTFFTTEGKNSHPHSLTYLGSKRSFDENKGYLPGSENKDRLRKIICDENRENNDEFASEDHSCRTDDTGGFKHAISTRDSFSSGLGTGTESDIIPSEIGGAYVTKEVVAGSPPLHCDMSIAEKSRYIRNERKRRSYNRAMALRECASRRSLRSNQQKHLMHKSGTWSARGSSGNERSMINTFLPPGSHPSSATDFSMTAPESVGSSFTTENTKLSSDSEKPIYHKQTEKINVKQENTKEKKKITENKISKKDNIVSTYFNIHFPPRHVTSANVKASPLTTTMLSRAEVHVKEPDISDS